MWTRHAFRLDRETGRSGAVTHVSVTLSIKPVDPCGSMGISVIEDGGNPERSPHPSVGHNGGQCGQIRAVFCPIACGLALARRRASAKPQAVSVAAECQ